MDPKKVLKGMLEKAYRIESLFENEAYFKAFMNAMNDEQREVLMKLMMESEKHKIMLENLAKELEIELERSNEKFEFSSRTIFNEIYEFEVAAKTMYEKIVENFREVLGNKVVILKELIEDEREHANLVYKFIDKTLRIPP